MDISVKENAEKISHRKTEDNDAVRTLIQGLKTCLNKGTFPTELQPMMNFLNQFMGQPSQKEPAKKRNRTSNSVKSNESSRQVQVEPVPTELETGWWKQNGQWKAYLRNPHTGWWWWKDTTKTETQEQHTSYAQAPTKNHSLQQPRTKPNLAKVRAVNPSEWTTHVRLVEPQTVCEAIKAGQQWQGNICCIHSLKLAQELRDLYNSFAITQGLTLVLSGEAGNQLGVTLSRARLQRTNAGPALEEVSLLGLGKDFPWRNHALTVDPQKVITKIERELVRIVVPNHYRELFVPEPGAERIRTFCPTWPPGVAKPTFSLVAVGSGRITKSRGLPWLDGSNFLLLMLKCSLTILAEKAFSPTRISMSPL